jgi:hypothetical protein
MTKDTPDLSNTQANGDDRLTKSMAVIGDRQKYLEGTKEAGEHPIKYIVNELKERPLLAVIAAGATLEMISSPLLILIALAAGIPYAQNNK